MLSLDDEKKIRDAKCRNWEIKREKKTDWLKFNLPMSLGRVVQCNTLGAQDSRHFSSTRSYSG